ncbi:MAG TPA: adenylyltransferase/cytidyltransferase family protein [Candidatus Saccharimonadales bacterium]
MKEAVLYTGTFDPFHLGHLWQIERTYSAHPFEKVVIAMISENPKKPNATGWDKRKKLAELMLASKILPFEVEIYPIDYVQPEKLKDFTAQHLSGYRVMRTIASDVIVEFAKDTDFNFNNALLLFHYAVVVRPLVGEVEMARAIAALPQDIRSKLSYEIVHVQTENDISGTNIRKNPIKAYVDGYITHSQLKFIEKNSLYL